MKVTGHCAKQKKMHRHHRTSLMINIKRCSRWNTPLLCSAVIFTVAHNNYKLGVYVSSREWGMRVADKFTSKWRRLRQKCVNSVPWYEFILIHLFIKIGWWSYLFKIKNIKWGYHQLRIKSSNFFHHNAPAKREGSIFLWCAGRSDTFPFEAKLLIRSHCWFIGVVDIPKVSKVYKT